MPMGIKKKRFGVLLCAGDSEYVKKKYGGYSEVFMGLLGEEGETWDFFRTFDGQLPNAEDIEAYDGFVISGSCSDAHGTDVWILNLVELIKRLDSMRKKILGVCFGHQILSRALGGKTGRASKGWDIGVNCIHLSPSNKLLSSLCMPSQLLIIECHRDEVWQPPPNAEILARSDRTGVEMFRYGEHIMGIQGHPEYTKDILLHLVDRLLKCKQIQTSQTEAAVASLDGRETDREEWKKLCTSFLKGKSMPKY